MQVPLGVFLKNENKLDEMADILDDLHKYVPKVRMTQEVEISGPGLQEVEISGPGLQEIQHKQKLSTLTISITHCWEVTNSQLPGFMGAIE